jgi:Outer membrane protein beta-barrel domain
MRHNYLISKVMLGLLSLLFAASAANADEFSIGVSGVSAPVSLEESGTVVDGDSSGWRFHGRYMFNKTFGIEGGLSKFGSPNDNSIPSNMHIDTESVDVYVVAAYPIGNDSVAYAKVGYIAWDSETEVNDSNPSHKTSTDLALSIGGEYDLTERFGVRAELEWFDSALKGELKYSLGGVVRFK